MLKQGLQHGHTLQSSENVNSLNDMLQMASGMDPVRTFFARVNTLKSVNKESCTGMSPSSRLSSSKMPSTYEKKECVRNIFLYVYTHKMQDHFDLPAFDKSPIDGGRMPSSSLLLKSSQDNSDKLYSAFGMDPINTLFCA